MATAEGMFLGNEELLFVADGDSPANPLDEAGYTPVSILISNGFDGTSETIRAANKAVSRFQAAEAGSAGYTITVEGNRKVIADEGMKILRDAWLAGTQVAWLISTARAGEEAKYGVGKVTAYSEPSGTNEFTTFTATIEGDGPPTFGPVPA